MDVFRWIRWTLPYNRLSQMLYQDQNGNSWPLNDAWTYTQLRAPLELGTFVLYLPSPVSQTVRQVYSGPLNVYDILSILNSFYNRPLTPDERQAAVSADLQEFFPELEDPNSPVRLSDLMFERNQFQGFSRYRDGWMPVFGQGQ
jgi:hypothetical protein